ncbi:hypothetical protein [Herbaspirillum sp. SJZ102]|uniref:hypothetical protein n=1 Tax=Herbaspirillum sp. SJZ102 TaxID=2723070 RepID=UPI00114F3E08|nr:hypothetical protein [Herbaspirillum sp. SJZ102]
MLLASSEDWQQPSLPPTLSQIKQKIGGNMAWDITTSSHITRERLKLSTPEVVYRELDEYGQYLATGVSRWNSDDALENALLQRNDRLINLGLAKNAGSQSVIKLLYSQSLAGTGDNEYDYAVRLACLANLTAPLGAWGLGESSDSDDWEFLEVRRLACSGSSDELLAMLRNPARRYLLPKLFERAGPFDTVDEKRWLHLLRFASGNPGLTIDDSTIAGPDFINWDINKAIIRLLQTAMVTSNSINVLHDLLMNLDPANTRMLGSREEFSELINRWKLGDIPSTSDSGKRVEGYYSTCTLEEELQCVMAALYGSISEGKAITAMGSLDAPELAFRCAYYGREKMNAAEIQEAWSKDKAIFVLAALFNNQILLNPDSRRELEGYVSHELQHLYVKRCTQLHAHYKWFSVSPVTEELKDVKTEVAPRVVDAEMIERLAKRIVAVEEKLVATSKQIWWVAVILGAIMFYHR